MFVHHASKISDMAQNWSSILGERLENPHQLQSRKALNANERKNRIAWTEIALSMKVLRILHVDVKVVFVRFYGLSNIEMNDFPVIGDLVMRTGLWDRQGANIGNRYKEMYGVELFVRLRPVSLDRECRILP